MKEQNFKVGDKVRRTNPNITNYIKQGDIVTIKSFDEDDPDLFYCNEIGTGRAMSLNNFELVDEIDYRVKGTKIPPIGKNIIYSTVDLGGDSIRGRDFIESDLVSYGSTDIKIDGEECILVDKNDYNGDNYYIVKLSNIIKPNLSIKNILFYRLIKPEYKKIVHELINMEIADDSNDFILTEKSITKLNDYGVLNSWFEPVYKTKDVFLDDWKGRRVKVEKDRIIIGNDFILLSSLKTLFGSFTVIISTIGNKSWDISLIDATFKIGCWGDVKLSDIKRAIEAIENF
jgi:hypothetical protein